MSSVLQPWLEKIPWKQQSILFSGLRGPDNQHAKAVKAVCKWMRSVSQKNADPSKGYMNAFILPEAREGSDLDKELENLPVHFVHHFSNALKVIAVNHPDILVRGYAGLMYDFIAEEMFHHHPETNKEFSVRHADKIAHE
jgi:hypothetical protein